VARNLWELALVKWRRQDQAKQNPDPDVQEEILGELVRDDHRSGNDRQLLSDLKELEKTSPNKASVDKEIQDVKARLAH
jgi:hypothetical protein